MKKWLDCLVFSETLVVEYIYSKNDILTAYGISSYGSPTPLRRSRSYRFAESVWVADIAKVLGLESSLPEKMQA